MALNVGNLVAYLELDKTDFSRKAEQASAQMTDLKTHLAELAAARPNIKVTVDAKTAELDALQARLTELKAQGAAGVDVRVDTAETLIKIAALRQEIRGLRMDAITTTPALAGMVAVLNRVGSTGAGTPGGPGGILGWIVGLLPLLPAMLASATSGIVTFAGAALFAAGQVASGLPALLAGLGVLKLAIAGMKDSGTGRRVIATGTSFLHKAELAAVNAMAPGVLAGLRALVNASPVVYTMISRISGAIGDLAARAGKAFQDPFWRQWFAWFGQVAANDVSLFGTAIGNFLYGLAQGFQIFRSGEGKSFAQWVDDMSVKFRNWVGSPEFLTFLAKLREDAAKTIAWFKNFGSEIKPQWDAFWSGLSATGAVYWSIIAQALQLISKLPTGVFTVLAATLPPIFLAAKGLGALNGLAAILPGLSKVGSIATGGAAAEGSVKGVGAGLATLVLAIAAGNAAVNAAAGAGHLAAYEGGTESLKSAIKNSNASASAATLGVVDPDTMSKITQGIADFINGTDNDWSLVNIFTKQIPNAWNTYVVPFFTKAIPDWLKSVFVDPPAHFFEVILPAAMVGVGMWLRTSITDPVVRFFTVTIPGAVTGIGSWLNTAIVSPIVGFFANIGSYVGNIGGMIASWFVGVWNTVRSAIKAVPVLGAAVSAVVPGFANGTLDAPGGLAWVGERGPELVNLPKHSQVIPAAESRAIGPGVVNHIYVTVGELVDTTQEKLEAMLLGAANRVMVR